VDLSSLSSAAATPHDRESSSSPTDPARVKCFVNRCWAFGRRSASLSIRSLCELPIWSVLHIRVPPEVEQDEMG
jgi:hypothetical protein